MILRTSFDDFLRDRVNLNATRLARIQSAHHAVRSVLAADAALEPDYVGTFLQGSYAQGTATRSPFAHVYDVDVVLALDLADRWGGLPSGLFVLNALADALEASSTYAGKVEVRERCVRVAYSSDGMDFHLDVLPADAPDGMQEPLRIPRDWGWTDPRGFKAWLDDRNRNGSGDLRRVIRLLKYWRSVQGLAGPSSMVLSTLAGWSLPATSMSVDDALVATLEGIAAWADGASEWVVPSVYNPTMPEEDLARDWSGTNWRAFRGAVGRAAEAARTARDSRDEEEAIACWNGSDLYDGWYPTTVRGLGAGARETAAAFTAGTLPAWGAPRAVVTPNRGYYGRRG